MEKTVTFIKAKFNVNNDTLFTNQIPVEEQVENVAAALVKQSHATLIDNTGGAHFTWVLMPSERIEVDGESFVVGMIERTRDETFSQYGGESRGNTKVPFPQHIKEQFIFALHPKSETMVLQKPGRLSPIRYAETLSTLIMDKANKENSFVLCAVTLPIKANSFDILNHVKLEFFKVKLIVPNPYDGDFYSNLLDIIKVNHLTSAELGLRGEDIPKDGIVKDAIQLAEKAYSKAITAKGHFYSDERPFKMRSDDAIIIAQEVVRSEPEGEAVAVAKAAVKRLRKWLGETHGE